MTFHVPHHHRIRSGRLASLDSIGNAGAFWIPRSPGLPPLAVIASDGSDGTVDHGWEHVSVSLPNVCPTWAEMSKVKEIFWDPEDVVMQLHVAASQHINVHPYCLHMWRPRATPIPLPPVWMVA